MRSLLGAPPARVAAAGGVWVGLAALLFLVMWPAGELAGAWEEAVDEPAFRWAQGLPGDPWWTVSDVVTRMGNTTQTRVATVVGAVAMAGLWWWHRRDHRRLAWLPLVVLPAAYVTAHYLQIWSADLVARGHPPTTLGTWPSGGVGRTILIYGLVAYFALLAAGVRRVLSWTWAVALALGAVEAWTRVHTLRHWLTDVAGGYLFGAALLAVVLASVYVVLAGRVSWRGAAPAPTPPPAPTARPR